MNLRPSRSLVPRRRVARLLRVAGRVLGLGLGLSGLAPTAQAQPAAPAPLVVCMADDNAPLSYQVKGQPQGLDLRIAQAAATRLGRPLRVVLFESEFENESLLTHEVNAMLSTGVCDAASGFPLLSGDLGPPSRAKARTASYPGAPRKRDRPFVPLGTLVGSRAYAAMALGVVLRDASVPLASLADLGDRKLGVVTGTLGGTVALTWRSGALRSRVVSLSQRVDMLDLLAGPAPTFDAALMPLSLFDGWKLAHPDGRLTAAQWRRPIGVNLGFVTLAAAADVRAAIDAVVVQALADGQLARWAADEGMSWLPPLAPDVGPGPTLGDLARLAGD